MHSVHISVGMCACMLMCRPSSGLLQDLLLYYFFLFLGGGVMVTVSLIDLEFAELVRVAGKQVPGLSCLHLASTGITDMSCLTQTSM